MSIPVVLYVCHLQPCHGSKKQYWNNTGTRKRSSSTFSVPTALSTDKLLHCASWQRRNIYRVQLQNHKEGQQREPRSNKWITWYSALFDVFPSIQTFSRHLNCYTTTKHLYIPSNKTDFLRKSEEMFIIKWSLKWGDTQSQWSFYLWLTVLRTLQVSHGPNEYSCYLKTKFYS